jgi:hypothetical protein
LKQRIPQNLIPAENELQNDWTLLREDTGLESSAENGQEDPSGTMLVASTMLAFGHAAFEGCRQKLVKTLRYPELD